MFRKSAGGCTRCTRANAFPACILFGSTNILSNDSIALQFPTLHCIYIGWKICRISSYCCTMVRWKETRHSSVIPICGSSYRINYFWLDLRHLQIFFKYSFKSRVLDSRGRVLCSGSEVSKYESLEFMRKLCRYSRVHISSDEVFSKILKKPSIVQK